MKTQTLKLFAATFGIAIFLASSLWLVANFAINQMNERQLQSLASSAIVRIERTIDLAATSMGKLAAANHFNCNPTDRIAMRNASYTASMIRDIRIQMDQTSCWGLDRSSAMFDKTILNLTTLPAVNDAYQLARVDLGNWKGLMVKWQGGENWNVLAMIGTSGLLFDLLPADLRENSSIEMKLNDDTAVAGFQADQVSGISRDYQHFSAASERYPLKVELAIDRTLLSGWNKAMLPRIKILMVLMSLVVGYLAARGLVRAPSQVDELDRAIARGEIVPYYQPLFSLTDNRMLGFELLARWIKADGSMVSPAVFIPLAEDKGRINAVTNTLLTQAGREIGPLLAADPTLKMSFNITPEQLLAPDFVKNLLRHVAASGLPPESLVIEITERQAISDITRATEVSRDLLASGVRIAIDDAGTGHNGLSSMHALNANYLKIDKYFIDGVGLNRKSSALIEMLVSLAKQFGMTVVAEGIETDAQVAALRLLGINEGQGYVHSRPVPAKVLNDLFAQAGGTTPSPDIVIKAIAN